MPQRKAGPDIFWLSLRHRCGCYLDWGTPVRDRSPATRIKAQKELFEFFTRAAPFPCPLHGSATGAPAPALEPGECRYMPANGVWYRACPADRHIYGDRVAARFGIPRA